jgi:hypothetical protein
MEQIKVRPQANKHIYVHNDLSNAAYDFNKKVNERLANNNREGIAFDIFLNSYSWPLQWLCLKSRIMSQLMRQIGTEYIEGSTRQLDQGHRTSRDQVQHPVLDSIEAVATTISLRYLLQPSHKLNH